MATPEVEYIQFGDCTEEQLWTMRRDLGKQIATMQEVRDYAAQRINHWAENMRNIDFVLESFGRKVK